MPHGHCYNDCCTTCTAFVTPLSTTARQWSLLTNYKTLFLRIAYTPSDSSLPSTGVLTDDAAALYCVSVDTMAEKAYFSRYKTDLGFSVDAVFFKSYTNNASPAADKMILESITFTDAINGKSVTIIMSGRDASGNPTYIGDGNTATCGGIHTAFFRAIFLSDVNEPFSFSATFPDLNVWDVNQPGNALCSGAAVSQTYLGLTSVPASFSVSGTSFRNCATSVLVGDGFRTHGNTANANASNPQTPPCASPLGTTRTVTFGESSISADCINFTPSAVGSIGFSTAVNELHRWTATCSFGSATGCLYCVSGNTFSYNSNDNGNSRYWFEPLSIDWSATAFVDGRPAGTADFHFEIG